MTMRQASGDQGQRSMEDWLAMVIVVVALAGGGYWGLSTGGGAPCRLSLAAALAIIASMLDGTAGADGATPDSAPAWHARCLRLPAWLSPVILVVLCAAVVRNNQMWLQASALRVNFDLPLHARRALEMLYAWNRGDVYQVLAQPGHGHGPAGYLIGALGMKTLGVSLETLLFSTSMLVPLYAFAIYQIGKDLYGQSTGFWAVVYGLSIPLFVDASKQYPLEISSQTFTLLALMLLFKSDGLRRPFLAAGFGLFVGLALLTKNEMAAVWAVPLAALTLAVISRLTVGGQGRGAAIASGVLRLMVLAGLCGAAVAFVLAYPVHHDAWNHHLQADVSGWLWTSFVIVTVALGAGALCARFASRPVSRLAGLLVALTVMAVLVFPRAVATDLESVVQERISSSVMGSQFVEPFLDPVKSGRLFVSRAWHYGYTLLLGFGVIGFLTAGDHRDRRRLFFFGFFVWVATLLAVIPSKFEYYQLNLVGFTAVVAVAPLLRVRWVAAPLMGLLAVWAGVHIFGWMAVPPRIDKEQLYPFQTYDVIELANHRFTPSAYPLLAEPPVLQRPLISDALRVAADDARGPFMLIVIPTPGVYTFYHHDTFHMVALFDGVPAVIVANPSQLIDVEMDDALRASPPPVQVEAVLAQIPVYFAAQGEAAEPLDARARQFLDSFLQTRAHVRPRLLRAYDTSDSWRLQLYRVNTDLKDGGRTPRR